MKPRLMFVLFLHEKPSWYLVYCIGDAGVRFLGRVSRDPLNRKLWRNNHELKTYASRRASAAALI